MWVWEYCPVRCAEFVLLAGTDKLLWLKAGEAQAKQNLSSCPLFSFFIVLGLTLTLNSNTISNPKLNLDTKPYLATCDHLDANPNLGHNTDSNLDNNPKPKP